jgi:hypothetical protein
MSARAAAVLLVRAFRVGALAVIVCAALSCGGSKTGGVPVDVPVGLAVHCDSAFDGGTIPSNGTWVDGALASRECLLYRVDTTAGARYSVQVRMMSGSDVDVIVASTDEFKDLISGAIAPGDSPESTSFVSKSGETYHIAIIGRADHSMFSTRVVLNIPSPLGQRECTSTLPGGELPTDGTGLDDIVFSQTCVLYTFAGTVDGVYRLSLVLDGARAGSIRDLVVARDRDVTDRIESSSFLELDTTMYFTTAATQTYYVLVVGEMFDTAPYHIAVERGNAPIGLADRCFHAVSEGPAPAAWREVTATLPVRECHLYTLAATAGNIEFVGLQRLANAGGGDELRVTADPTFRSVLTTSSTMIEGSAAESLVAGATQTIYLAVLNQFSDITFDYGIRTLSSAPPPSALGLSCNRSNPGGGLTVDGAAVSGTAMNAECVAYSFAMQAGVIYTVTAEPDTGGVALFASQDFDGLQPLGSSSTSLKPQGLSFTAPATGTAHVSVIGHVDGTQFRAAVVTTRTAPAALSQRCHLTIDGGTLAVGAAATAGFALTDHCNLYSFAGVAGTSYTVTLTGVDETDPNMTLARDSNFTSIVAERTTSDDDAIVFTASASQTFFLAVHGFQTAEYTISVKVSPPPPPGLATVCSSVRDAGALAVGGAHKFDAAVPGQCVLYTFPGTSSIRYTVTVFELGGDPSLKVASDAAFTSVLTTQANTGGETFSFTAVASQDFRLAVFPSAAVETNFEIFVTSP